MRRVDRRTNALPDRPTDQPTDTASYRGALSHLKSEVYLQVVVVERDFSLNGTVEPRLQESGPSVAKQKIPSDVIFTHTRHPRVYRLKQKSKEKYLIDDINDNDSGSKNT